MMNKYLIRKYVLTVIFIISLFAVSGCYIAFNYKDMIADLKEADSFNKFCELIDDSINENIMGREAMIELYGCMNVVLDKREDNGFEIVKDKEGVLYYSQRPYEADTDELARRVKALEGLVSPDGTKVLAFIMPDKYMEDASEYYSGIPYRNGNAHIDKYIESLQRYGIECFDYRKTMENSGLSVKDLFFKTDHHWNVDAAFLAYQDCVKFFRESQGIDLDPESVFSDKNNYSYKTYENIMLGSMGRKTGYIYSGMEDFTIMIPKYETNLTVQYKPMEESEVTEALGSAEGAALQLSNLLEEDIYERDCYTVFMGGIQHEIKITNHNNPDGPKVLMLMDSYSSPFNIFFSQSCSQLDGYWIVELEEDIEEKIKKEKYDYVIISTYVESLEEGNFAFCEE